MPIRVGQTVRGQLLDVRRLNEPAPRLHRREPDVVEHDVQHVRRALRRDRLDVRRPVRHRISRVDVDDAVEALGHASPFQLQTVEASSVATGRTLRLTRFGRTKTQPGIAVSSATPARYTNNTIRESGPSPTIFRRGRISSP